MLMLFQLPNGFGIVPVVQRIKPKLFWQKWNFRAERLKKVFFYNFILQFISDFVSCWIVLNISNMSIYWNVCNIIFFWWESKHSDFFSWIVNFNWRVLILMRNLLRLWIRGIKLVFRKTSKVGFYSNCRFVDSINF